MKRPTSASGLGALLLSLATLASCTAGTTTTTGLTPTHEDCTDPPATATPCRPDAAPGDPATDGGDASSSSPGPIIASLTASPSTIGPAGTATVSAIVSHPAGLSLLSGGTLLDPESGTTYGAFGTPGGQGTFIYGLTWDALETVRTIDIPAGASSSRRIMARFFDNAGGQTSQELTLTLKCSSTVQTACGGACIDLATDTHHCGSCAHDCAKLSPDATCKAGKCAGISEESSAIPLPTCDTVCKSHGLVCACPTGCAFFKGNVLVPNLTTFTCSQAPPPFAMDATRVLCTCHE